MKSEEASKLVLIEGTSLWSSSLPPASVFKEQWNSLDIMLADGTGSSAFLNTLDDVIPNTKASYAWIAGNSSVPEEQILQTNFLANLSRKRPDGLYVFDGLEQEDVKKSRSCPAFAFPLSSCAGNSKLAQFFSTVRQSLLWSSDASTGASGEQVTDNNTLRLSFLSILVILVGAMLLAWMLYFGLKSYRRKNSIDVPTPSPNKLWMMALTLHPRKFLFLSLFVPLCLSFLGIKKSGYSVNLNLDFDTYLTIDTDMELIAQSYSAAQRYQRESLRIEEENCEILQATASASTRRSLFEYNNRTRSHESHRDLQYQLYSSTGPRITILYQNRNGGNVFEPEVLQQIKDFEESILAFPGFKDFCFNIGTRCVPFDSPIPQFFPGGNLVGDIDGVLKTFFGDPTSLWKVDQYFSPTNLASNITRSFIWLRDVGDDQSAADDILERLHREFWALDQDKKRKYPDLVFTWENDHMTTVEANDAVSHDALWASGSFIFIGIMIFLKVRNVFIFLCSMLGLGLSFSTAYYWTLVHFGIPEITLLHVSSLFVMMGIGADDIFLMVDSFDHTRLSYQTTDQETKNEDASSQLQKKPSSEDTSVKNDTQEQPESNHLQPCPIWKRPDILRERMIAAYAMAGSMMLVSSLTTAICFFSNAFAVVVVIRDFGIYMGMVVLVNFLHVMTILPSAIMVNQLYLLPWQARVGWKCRCLFNKIGSSMASKTAEREEDLSNISSVEETSSKTPPATKKDTTDVDAPSADIPPEHGPSTNPSLQPMDQWLVDKYVPFVVRRRFALVIGLGVLAGALGTWGISSFTISDGEITLFTDKYNLGRLATLNDKYFNADLTQTIEAGAGSGSPNFGGSNNSGGSNSGGSSGGGGSLGGSFGGGGSSAGGGTSGGNNSAAPPQSSPSQEDSQTGGGEGPGLITLPSRSPTAPPPTVPPTTPSDSSSSNEVCPLFCQNGGLCAWLGPDNPVCSCNVAQGWTGIDCSVPVCPVVNFRVCADNGSCERHPNGIEGSTACVCNEGFTGRGCNIKEEVVETALTRRESVFIELVWGAEPPKKDSKVWRIRDVDSNDDTSTDSPPVQSTFDLSELRVQEWLFEVISRARNQTSLNVQIEPTWIEIFKIYAEEIGVGFPVPQDQFVGFLQILRARNFAFKELLRYEIGTSAPGLAGDFLFASLSLFADIVIDPVIAEEEDSLARPGESLSARTLRLWRRFADEINAEAAENGLPNMVAQSKIFLDPHRSEETISSTTTSWLLANGLCLLVILFFTRNVVLTLMVMFTSIMIFLCLAGVLFGALSLPFGPVEALGVSIFIGLAANYSIHVVHAYHHSMKPEDPSHTQAFVIRSEKVKDAIFATGSPIAASALSTFGGCLFLFACRTYVFFELGVLICSISTFALIFSMGFLTSWLDMIGPLPVLRSSHIEDHENGRSTMRIDTIEKHRGHEYDMAVMLYQMLQFFQTVKRSSEPSSGSVSEDGAGSVESGMHSSREFFVTVLCEEEDNSSDVYPNEFLSVEEDCSSDVYPDPFIQSDDEQSLPGEPENP